jgi:Tfp pilus assembly protein PilE
MSASPNAAVPQSAGPKKKMSGGILAVIVAGVLLLLVVPCIGITAAIAIPSFIGYLRRSKTSEASSNLTTLYQGAAAYYREEHIGPNGEILVGCTVPSARTSNAPGAAKSVIAVEPGSSFEALGFAPLDPVYYQYEIVSVGGCGHGPNENLYSFRAHGDLDGDGTPSLFELTAGSDAANEPTRAAGVYTENELE